MIIVPIAIFFLSAAVLGLELVLVRALSISNWHHFSYMVISTALLGFGAGGTFITIFSRYLTKGHYKSLWSFALGLAVTVPCVFTLCQKVPLDELQLIWDRRQILYLFAYYLLFFVPFFCGGSCIALAFTIFAHKAHRLYFFNMVGSGLGAAAIVLLMYGNSPEKLLLVISAAAFLATLIFAFAISRRWVISTLIIAATCLFAFSPAGPLALKIEISENKSLVYYSAVPQAEIIAERYSPLAWLNCLSAPSIRHFPGLSFAYQGQLPKQILIIADADGASPVTSFSTLDDLKCYDYITSAVPYHLLSSPRVCVIGAGGGSDVAQALALGAAHVTAVEMNAQTCDLVRNQLNDFAGGLYHRPDVRVVVAEGRNFMQTTNQLFDIIGISLLDSQSASAAGLYALNESHLYTIEAIEHAISRLQPNGLLSITRMLKNPPRDSLKMLATLAQALRHRGITNFADHIIMIRSWATTTILVSPQPFSDSQIKSTRNFAANRYFDLVHVPGIKPKDINTYHVLPEPIYYECAQQILSQNREDFFRNYTYNIRPATDDRPYFFDFFKWRALPHLIQSVPGQWLPFSEWGYLVLVANLFQALLAGTFLIVLPLWIAKPLKAVTSGKLFVFIYFLLLGFAYMFLEMGFIQKLTLLIGHPVFGVAVTLLGFLVFSGFGSLISAKLFQSPTRRIQVAVLAIIIIGIVEINILKFSFDWLLGFSLPLRCVLGLAITAPLAFFMGMPFPSALKQLYTLRQPLVPWAWGINGFASVIGAVLGTFLAISVGFTTLTLIALAAYLLAATIAKRVCT